MQERPEPVNVGLYFQQMCAMLAQDPSYRQRLETDFRSCAAELGWDLPVNHPYRPYFDTPEVHHVVILKCPLINSSKVRF